MEPVPLSQNQRYLDMLTSDFIDMKSCVHPDPDVMCLECDCWKADPFKNIPDEDEKTLDNLINM